MSETNRNNNRENEGNGPPRAGTVSVTNLSKEAKPVYFRIVLMLIMDAGLAETERPTTTYPVLCRQSRANFVRLVRSCDIAAECTRRLRCDVPSPQDITLIKRLALQLYGGDDDTKVWKKFGELKCTLRNIYWPNYFFESGDNEDDAILRASQHHWLWKRNKSITSSNNRYARLGREDKIKPLETIDNAPTNLHQRPHMLPEAVVFLHFKDDLRFDPEHGEDGGNQPPSPDGDDAPNASTAIPPPKSKSKKKKKRHVPKNCLDTDITCLDDSDDDEVEVIEHSQKFKSRYAQRKQERTLKSKSIATATKATRDKASALRATAQLQALSEARKMGARPEFLQPLMLQTIGTLFDDTTGTGGKKRKGGGQVINLCKGEKEEEEENEEDKKMPAKKKAKSDETWEEYEERNKNRIDETCWFTSSTTSHNNPYSTPPREEVMRDWILTQREIDSSAEESSPDPNDDIAKMRIEHKLIFFKGESCCAGDDCKRKGEPFPNTLECPLCDGFVHYQCADFKWRPMIGSPVCAKCRKV